MLLNGAQTEHNPVDKHLMDLEKTNLRSTDEKRDFRQRKLFSMNAKLSTEITDGQTLPDMIAIYRQLRSYVGDLSDVWLQTSNDLIAQKGWPVLQLEGLAKLNCAVHEIDAGIRKLVGWAHPDQLESLEDIQSETYDPTIGQSEEARKLYWEQVEAAMAAMPQPESVPVSVSAAPRAVDALLREVEVMPTFYQDSRRCLIERVAMINQVLKDFVQGITGPNRTLKGYRAYLRLIRILELIRVLVQQLRLCDGAFLEACGFGHPRLLMLLERRRRQRAAEADPLATRRHLGATVLAMEVSKARAFGFHMPTPALQRLVSLWREPEERSTTLTIPETNTDRSLREATPRRRWREMAGNGGKISKKRLRRTNEKSQKK
jgi:hypothetical protein